MHLDYTIDQDCADSIRSSYEYRGTAEEIEQQHEALDILLGLPTRYMDNRHMENLSQIIDRIQYDYSDDKTPCDSSEIALDAFYEVRRASPMGQWRANILENYWPCTYPGEGFRLLGHDRHRDQDYCDALLSWMPESWKPPGLSEGGR